MIGTGKEECVWGWGWGSKVMERHVAYRAMGETQTAPSLSPLRSCSGRKTLPLITDGTPPLIDACVWGSECDAVPVCVFHNLSISSRFPHFFVTLFCVALLFFPVPIRA